MEMRIYDIVGLAKDLELEYEDITDLYISYIEEVENHCVNFMELISEAHNVKGVAANLLLKDVFEEADLFERLLKKGDFASSKEHMESLLSLLINSKDKIIKSFAQVNVII
jgi:HPt (histidine-containing phosphotransfer) domain-containing protein